MKPKKLYWENWGVLSAGLAVLTTAFFLKPDSRGLGTHEQLFLPPCFFLWLTHLPCPSCGLTTSFAYLAKGHFWKAIVVHPMGPLLFASLLFLMGGALWGLFQDRSFWDVTEKPLTLWIGGFLLSGLLVTWIFRLWLDQRLLFAVRSF